MRPWQPFSHWLGGQAGWTGSGSSGDGLMFELLAGDSGYTNLSNDLSINGSTVSPTYVYRGHEASVATWTAHVGSNVSSASTGTDPTVDSYTPFTDTTCESVKFNAGKIYQAASNTIYDLANEDFVFELIFANVNADQTLLAKKAQAGSGTGYLFNTVSNGSSIRLSMSGSGGGATPSVTLTQGLVWHHVMFFGDKSENSTNGCLGYVNGSAGSGVNISGVGSLTNTSTFTIGANSVSSTKWSSHLAYAAMWKQSDWFPGGASNPTAWAAVALERAARVMGVYPSRALGTASPSTKTRATTGYVDRIVDSSTNERRVFLVGNNWIRVGRRREDSGDGYLTGYLCEPSSTNLCLQSQTFQTTWTPNALSVAADGYTAPDGQSTADGLVSAAGSNDHHIFQSITLTAASHTFSVFAKRGSQDWIGLYIGGGVNNGRAFNLASGTVGSLDLSSGTAVSGQITPFGNGWYRISATYTATAVATNHYIQLMDSDYDGSGGDGYQYASDGTIGSYVWGAQVEAQATDTTYIPTTTASATRNADQLAFNLNNYPGTSPVTLFSQALMQNYNNSNTKRQLGIGTGVNTIEHAESSGFGNSTGIATTTQWNISSASQISDGEIHSIRTVAETDNVRVYYDDALRSTDTSASIPAPGSGSITIGGRAGVPTEGHPIGIVGPIRIWRKPRIPE